MTQSDPTAGSAGVTFDGELLLREDDGFEAARIERVFNRRMPGRQPAAVLKVGSEADVVRGVRLAKERGWKVAVRSGGHSWPQWSIREDALVLDLAALCDLGYDEATGVAWAGPATKGGGVLSPFLESIGRFFPGGHCPTVGIGGFLLQGGQGWNARGRGWAAEYIVGIDVVTADGELVHADAEENADLFWAARGAGPGFFGVVTKFYLQTIDPPGHYAETLHVYPLAEYDTVFTWLQRMHHDLDWCVELVAVTKTDPEFGSEPVIVVSALALADDVAHAERALAPFRECPALDRALLVVDNREADLAEHRARQLVANPEGHRWVVDNAWLDGTPEQVVEAARTAFTELPGDLAFTIWFSMAPLRPLPDMAFSLQSDIYLASYVVWQDPALDEAHTGFIERAFTDLQPVTVGQYLGDGDLSRRQVKFMADENWARLQQIRAERDPDNLFVGYLAGEGGATNRNHWE